MSDAKTTPEAIAAITAANEAKTTARLKYEAARREMRAAEKVFHEKAKAAQDALDAYGAIIDGETK